MSAFQPLPGRLSAFQYFSLSAFARLSFSFCSQPSTLKPSTNRMRGQQIATELNVSPEALRRARLALSRHAECFWTRRSDAPVVDRDDVELIIRRLRENGGTAAWQTALQIQACL